MMRSYRGPFTVLFLAGALLALPLAAQEESSLDISEFLTAEEQAVAAGVCIGQGFIDVAPNGARTISTDPLACAGLCSKPNEPRVLCSEQTNAAGDRKWCGCAGEAEPTLCHISKVKVNGNWSLDCQGPCPIPTDVCTPNYRTIAHPDPDKPEGTKRIVMSCECEAPPVQDLDVVPVETF